jgi:hypothetical protein
MYGAIPDYTPAIVTDQSRLHYAYKYNREVTNPTFCYELTTFKTLLRRN